MEGLKAGPGKWGFLSNVMGSGVCRIVIRAQREAKPFHKRKQRREVQGRVRTQEAELVAWTLPGPAWGGSEENPGDPPSAGLGRSRGGRRSEEFALEQVSDVNTSCSIFSTKYSVKSTLLTNARECKIVMGQQQRRHPRTANIDAVTSNTHTIRTAGSFLHIRNLIHLKTIRTDK